MSDLGSDSGPNGTSGTNGTNGTSGIPPAAMRRTLARARDGKALDPGEATVLLHARGDDLTALLGYAGRTRDAGLEAAGRPGIITYSRKVFIPLTRLCRDRCGYCTFATVPHRLHSLYLEPDEVLEIARQGAALGCKEALFTLGDRPELRWRQAKDWLDAHGYDDTLSSVPAMAPRAVGRDPPRPLLFTKQGHPHFGSPDKVPAGLLRVLEDAGRCNVPFTTG